MSAMRKVADWDELWEHGIGAFFFQQVDVPEGSYRALWVLLPDPEHPNKASLAMLPLKPAPGGRASWEFDGNEDAPTLSPSVWHGPPNGWHGFIRAGQLVPA